MKAFLFELTSGVLGDGNERLGSLVEILWCRVFTDKLDIVIQANNTAALTSLYILLADIAGLVIEQPV